MSATPPPIGVALSCMELTDPLEVFVVAASQIAEPDRPVSDLFAFHVPARRSRSDRLVRPAP